MAVVETAGDLLAVAGDERDGRAFVEQPDGGSDLHLGHGQFLSETGVYGLDGWARSHAKTLPAAPAKVGESTFCGLAIAHSGSAYRRGSLRTGRFVSGRGLADDTSVDGVTRMSRTVVTAPSQG